MTKQITIIGLGQIGASIGLALSEYTESILRVGTDLDNKAAQHARQIGAVDKVARNIRSAVDGADVIILAIPMDQVREVIETIAPNMKADAVLMDTSPLKVVVAGWAEELLPENCHYVGLTPALNPEYLDSEDFGVNAAQADLFHGGMLAITTAQGTASHAIHTAAELAQMVGAAPLFADIYEIDGVMTTIHILPQLVSAALANVALSQPGWSEAQKVAGRAFTEVTGPTSHLDDNAALAAMASLNKENMIRMLDHIIANLQFIRQDLENDDHENLEKRMLFAKTGIVQWLAERQEGKWLSREVHKSDVPVTSGIFGDLFGVNLPKKKTGNE